VVTLGAVLDAAQNAHWRVRREVVVEFDCVQVLHRDPPEDGTSLLNVRHTACRELAHKIGESLLILTSNLDYMQIGV